MFSGRCLRGIEDARARAPRDGRGNFTAFVRGDDVVKLAETLQSHNGHEGASEFGARGRGRPVRRLGEGDVEGEERREQVVVEARGAGAELGWDELGGEQIEESLLRIEARDHGIGGEDFSRGEFDTDGAALARDDAAQFDPAADFTAVFGDVGDEAAREITRAPDAHLGFRGRGEQRGDRVAETRLPQIDFAQTVEKKQAGPHGVVLEFARDEFQRGERGHCEQAAAEPAAFEERAATRRLQRWTLRLGDEEVFDDRAECFGPTAERAGIPGGECREGRLRALQVGPPFERAAVAQQQCDIEFGLDVTHTVAVQFEIAEPRHLRDRAVEKGMRVVRETRQARIFQRAQSAARCGRAVEGERAQAAAGEVSLGDEGVVAGAEEDCVVVGHQRRGRNVLRRSSNERTADRFSQGGKSGRRLRLVAVAREGRASLIANRKYIR